MNAWLATDASRSGEGLINILIVPRKNGNSLAVHITSDGRFWIDDELDGCPSVDSRLREVKIPEKLVDEIEFTFKAKRGDFNQHAKNLLLKFIKSA
jgi:hypothetical protein